MKITRNGIMNLVNLFFRYLKNKYNYIRVMHHLNEAENHSARLSGLFTQAVSGGVGSYYFGSYGDRINAMPCTKCGKSGGIKTMKIIPGKIFVEEVIFPCDCEGDCLCISYKEVPVGSGGRLKRKGDTVGYYCQDCKPKQPGKPVVKRSEKKDS